MYPDHIIASFGYKVNRTKDCWQWKAATGRHGYGLFWNGIKMVPAHRFAWEITHGPIPDGLFVCHRCDNPGCVRPAHLFLGTHQVNMDDRGAKGRSAKGNRHGSHTQPQVFMRGDSHYARTAPDRLARGEGHGMTSLTTEQVQEIRATYGTGPSYAAIARQYGVDRTTIFNIVHRKTWKHVP